MIDWVKTGLKILKLAPCYLVAPIVFSGFLLFSPVKILQAFGVADLADQHRQILGLILLGSISLLFITISKLLVLKWHKHCIDKLIRERLHNLTDDEKQILGQYIFEDTRTQLLNIRDGVVTGLIGIRILQPASNIYTFSGDADFNITSAAWDYLQEHPELLLTNETRPEYAEYISHDLDSIG